MNPGLSLRAASDADVGAITELIDSCISSYHPSGARTSVTEVRNRLLEGGSDPSVDSILAFDGRRLVGFGHVWPFNEQEVRAFARTAPDALGQGVGSALLRFCEERAQELYPRVSEGFMTLTNWAGDTAAAELLRARGYVPIRYFISMIIDLGETVGEVATPGGVTIRPVDPDLDRNPLHEAYVDAFADHWGYEDQTVGDWWHDRLDAQIEVFDPDLWVVATAGDELVGFSLCQIVEAGGSRQGRVGEIGVRRAWRGRGLGLSLLLHCFRAFTARGLDAAVLDVDADNSSPAISLYTKAGMTPRPTFTIWKRDLT